MKLNRFTDFGLRTLMRLAGNPEHAFSTRGLAEELQISRHHLTKVVARLSQAGYITSRRGNQGGIRLALSADDIKVGDVAAALESETSLVECLRPDGGACTLTPDCGLARRLVNARQSFIDDLNQSVLSDIAYRIDEPAD